MSSPIPESAQSRPRRRLALGLLAAVLAGTVLLLLEQKSVRSPRTEAPTEVSRTNLVLTGGRLVLIGHTNAFSGRMIEHYRDGSLRSRSEVLNGLLHGLSEGWHTNGQLQVSEHFRQGVSDGVRTKWYANGTKQSEANIVRGKLNGTYRKWHENGALSEQIQFVVDRPEGISLAYYPGGHLKARVELKDGKPVGQSFWADERKQ